METIKFTGWVEKVCEPTQYAKEIVVANYVGESGKDQMLQDFKDRKTKDYPIALKFKASLKSGAAEQLDLVEEGDKVMIQFCISGKSGISKSTGNYYCINELNICKKDGVAILAKSASGKVTPQSVDDDVADIPF